jgi:hypothetical protein
MKVRASTLAFANVATIVDLVPCHDPDIGGNVFRPCAVLPVMGGNRLHPLHPDGIVHMAQHVDMLRPGCEGLGEMVGHLKAGSRTKAAGEQGKRHHHQWQQAKPPRPAKPSPAAAKPPNRSRASGEDQHIRAEPSSAHQAGSAPLLPQTTARQTMMPAPANRYRSNQPGAGPCLTPPDPVATG